MMGSNLNQAMESLRITTQNTLQQMTESSVGVPIAFAIMLFLLLWLIIYAPGKWPLKGLAVAATLFFSISLWHSVDSLLGLPSETQLPEKFLVHWIVVEEPNKVTGDEGAIYIWAKNITPEKKKTEVAITAGDTSPNTPEKKETEVAITAGDTSPNDYILKMQEVEKETPRVHAVPYTRQMHQQAMAAMKMLKEGKPVFGEGKNFDNARKGKSKGKGKGDGKAFNGRAKSGKDGRSGRPGYSSVDQDPIFHELPPPKMPIKNDK